MTRFLALVLIALSGLTACSSVLGNAMQEVAFETPGASDSVCYVTLGNIQYRVWPPETIRVSKRPGPMNVRCLADGNREKTVVIEPRHVSTALANGFNGFAPGLFVDYKSGAMFEYPQVVTVDFTDIATQKMPLPDYHRQIEDNPSLFGMEEFRPGDAALMSDKNVQDYELKKRDLSARSSEFLPPVSAGGGGAADSAPDTLRPDDELK